MAEECQDEDHYHLSTETNTTKYYDRQRNGRSSNQTIPREQSGTLPRIKLYSLFVYEKRQDDDDERESSNQIHTFIHG